MNKSKMDEICLQYLELIDEYQCLRLRLGGHLSGGFISLAKARYASGRDFGRDQYDSRMKATRTVSKSTDKWVLCQKDHDLDALVDEVSEKPGIRHRKHGSDHEIRPESVGMDSNSNPLNWFGILVPSSLRESQTQFSLGLDDMIAIVNMERQLHLLEGEINQLRLGSDD